MTAIRYAEAKGSYPGMLLLLRVGDFFETFGADAIAVSLATDKTGVRRGDFIMIGFPACNLEAYLTKLLKRGHRMAMCEEAA